MYNWNTKQLTGRKSREELGQRHAKQNRYKLAINTEQNEADSACSTNMTTCAATVSSSFGSGRVKWKMGLELGINKHSSSFF